MNLVFIKYTALKLAELKNVTFDKINQQTSINFEKLFF